ncbi:hypothetical protein [Bradyrhizobium sp. ARR65]|uniref:hypothetical protein n=1 Tax=Bradyrhizobium sp. ARR65 TaxID=1040989 RepID=UPI0004637A28|nr:hypothetical protein [Bradyrhizobium sp. ARR65]
MSALDIYLTSASSDLKGYLDGVIGESTSNPYGIFNPASTPYDQWYHGGGTSSAHAEILSGNFTSYSGGNLTGTADTLTFGTGLSVNSSTGNASLANTELTIDYHHANVDAGPNSFDYSIYGIIKQAPSYFYTYLGDAGTNQHGTSGDDTLYSFYGNDTLTGNGGSSDFDTFKWDHSLYDSTHGFGNDTISDFVHGNDLIDFKGYGWSNYSQFISDSHVSVAGNTVTYVDPTNSSLHSTITVDGVSSLSASDFAFV